MNKIAKVDVRQKEVTFTGVRESTHGAQKWDQRTAKQDASSWRQNAPGRPSPRNTHTHRLKCYPPPTLTPSPAKIPRRPALHHHILRVLPQFSHQSTSRKLLKLASNVVKGIISVLHLSQRKSNLILSGTRLQNNNLSHQGETTSTDLETTRNLLQLAEQNQQLQRRVRQHVRKALEGVHTTFNQRSHALNPNGNLQEGKRRQGMRGSMQQLQSPHHGRDRERGMS